MNRRSFLLSTTALFLSYSVQAGINNPGSAGAVTPGFNGGKSQVQSWNLSTTGDFPFINLLKAATDWSYGDNSGNPKPNELNSDGYPTTIVHSGVKCIANIFPPSVRNSTYVLTWDGTGTLLLSVPNSGSNTITSGSLTSSGGVGAGRCEFTTTSPDAVVIGISAIGSPVVTNIKFFYKADESLLNAGEIFNAQYISTLRSGNPGVIRFLDWADANNTSVTTWATRKPQTYFSYVAGEYRSALYAGTSTNTGVHFSATLGSGAPVDKQTVQVTWSATAAPVATNVTLSNTNPAVVSWTAHGLSIGDAVSINSTQSFGMPAPLWNNRTYYVIAAGFTANSFEFSLTLGGAAVSTAGGTQSGQIQAFGQPTLNLNTTGIVPILGPWGDPSTDGPVSGKTATLVYDADLNGWLAFSGEANGSGGILNCVPPEIMVALCTKVGAHPHFCAPFFACDPMTDWHTQLATYVKNNGPSWMKPRFEGPNECWNPSLGFYSTRYAWNKSPVHWGISFSLNDFDWYGKVISTIGQDINAVYGGTPSTQTAYAMICGIQTVTAGSGANDPRLTSAQYVAQAAAPQAGYVKSAAFNWATHCCVANYWSPGERDTPTELVDAFNYTVTNNGNASAQLTIATSYINTANTSTTINGSAVSQFNLVSTKAFAVAAKAWAVGLGSGQVSKMCGYEGGYSPDYPIGDNSWNNGVTAISQAANAAITVGAFSTNNQSGTGAGAAVGMPITVSGVNGMTQINTGSGASVTVTAGSPGQVTFTAHGFSAGQAIFFEPQNFFGSALPVGVIFGQAYFVKTVIDANTFTVSATSGGTAINMTGAQAQGVSCVPCWVVTGITTNGSGVITSFTVNANSVGFTAYASAGTIIYGCSAYNVTMLRQAGKNVAALQGFTTQLYNDFVAAGGEFPSCYFVSGGAVVWGVWDPGIYTVSTPPQWAAIAAFNH